MALPDRPSSSTAGPVHTTTLDKTPDKTVSRAVLCMVLCQAMGTPMMLSAVNMALPHLSRLWDMDAVTVSWIPLSYLAASAMLILICGRLADRYGRKRLFLYGSCGSLISSVLAAAASGTTMLLIARSLQGASAAALYATQIALVSSVFSGPARGRCIGYTTGAIYLGLSTGPLLGSLLIGWFSWRASFLVHLPLSLIALILGLYRVPGEWAARTQPAPDTCGAALYVFAMLACCVGLSGLPSTIGLLLIGTGVLLMAGFVRHEYHTPAPLLHIRLFFSNRRFGLSCTAAWLHYTTTYANMVLIVLYLHYIHDMTIGMAALFLSIQPLTMSLSAWLSGRYHGRMVPRNWASGGLLISGIGLFILGHLAPLGDSLPYVAVGLLLTGTGIGMFVPANSTITMNAVTRDVLGMAAAVIATMRILGQMSSMVLICIVFTLLIEDTEGLQKGSTALQEAIATCFTLATLLTILALLCFWTRGQAEGEATGNKRLGS